MSAGKLYIPVGSGHIYSTEFTGTIPADSVIETEANRLGHIEGGGSIEYAPKVETFKDDLGLISRNKLTAEEATFKGELIAWSSADFAKFANTARVTSANGRRTVKIGGLSHDSGKRYLFRFVHKDEEFGDVRLTVVGTQSGGFTLTYKSDEASKMALEIKAEPSDNEGTLILYDETITED